MGLRSMHAVLEESQHASVYPVVLAHACHCAQYQVRNHTKCAGLVSITPHVVQGQRPEAQMAMPQ